MDELTAMMRNLQQKFDTQTNEIRELKQTIPEIINKNINENFTKLETKYNELEKIVEQQGRRIQQLERSIRKKNIVLFGLEESERNYYELQRKVMDIISQDMKINCREDNIESVRRLGKKTGKVRPVVITLNTMGLKIKLLKNKKNLDGFSYYIKEDFPPDILEERKKLKEQLQEEKNQGGKAILKYNKLIVVPGESQNNGDRNKDSGNRNKRILSESPEFSGSTNSIRKKIFNKPLPNNKTSTSSIQKYMVKNLNLENNPNPTSKVAIPAQNNTSPQNRI